MNWLSAYFKSSPEGRLSLYDYIQLCLYDPQSGYYRSQNVIGAGHDFITAPEISPLFGETIALWLAQQKAIQDPSWCLVELGPGKGTLMADILRTLTKALPHNLPKNVYLVECNSLLKQKQQERLSHEFPNIPFYWLDEVRHVDYAGPCMVLGNEFLDVFPIRGFRMCADAKLREIYVALKDNLFSLVDADVDDIEGFIPENLKEGEVCEYAPDLQTFTQDLAGVLYHPQSQALFFDYGYLHDRPANLTLQAIYRHQKVGIFDYPGLSDITACVDFSAFSQTIASLGYEVSMSLQRDFLLHNGAEALMRRVALRNPHQEKAIRDGFERITYNMGQSFQSCVVKRRKESWSA